jgi:hypothetical protein
MWRCDYCRARFDERDAGINHARARHSRDYTACREVGASDASGPGARWRLRWLPGTRGGTGLPHLAVAIVLAPLLAAFRGPA